MMSTYRYAVLLRGVNVGGVRRVPSGEFKTVLEVLGCTEVLTYINSGNAVCSSEVPLLQKDAEAALERYFGFRIPTLVLSADRVRMIAAAIPHDWTNDTPKPDKSGQKSDVLYLFDEINNPDILSKIGYKPEIETMIYVDGAVIANISRDNQARGSLQKVIGTPLYAQMTVRNVTTARKLADLMDS